MRLSNNTFQNQNQSCFPSPKLMPRFDTYSEVTITSRLQFFLQRMEEAGVDGALIVQPINHKFDHSYVTRYVALPFQHDSLFEAVGNLCIMKEDET